MRDDHRSRPLSQRVGLCGGDFHELPLEQICRIAKGYGVEYLELYMEFLVTLETLDAVENTVRSNGLMVPCVTSWSPMNESLEFRQLILESIDVAARFGAPFVITYFGSGPERSVDEAISDYVRNIQPCLRKAEKSDVTILLENEFSIVPPDNPGRLFGRPEITGTAENCLRILRAVNHPRFRFNFDAPNFCCAGEEPFPKAYRLLKDYIEYMHVKDVVRYEPGSEPAESRPEPRVIRDFFTGDYACVPVGRGHIPYSELISRLKEDNYPGFLMCEPHTEVPFRDTACRESIGFLRNVL